MYIPKRYGESKIERCPFCESSDGKQQPTMINSQGISVCTKHKNSILDVENMKCICGEYLELLIGKFGPYFKCMNCGNINIRKVLEINDINDLSQESSNRPSNKNYDRKRSSINQNSNQPKSTESEIERKEIFIRSDDPRYFD